MQFHQCASKSRLIPIGALPALVKILLGGISRRRGSPGLYWVILFISKENNVF
jgi:hypothetical protein